MIPATRTITTSPAGSFSTALASPSKQRVLGVYTSSALALVLIHIVMAYVLEQADPRLGFFVKSRHVKHLYLATSSFTLFYLSESIHTT